MRLNEFPFQYRIVLHATDKISLHFRVEELAMSTGSETCKNYGIEVSQVKIFASGQFRLSQFKINSGLFRAAM